MGYYLNPSELTSMFAVPSSVADRHLRLASAEQLKALLWALKNTDRGFDASAAAEALNIDRSDIAECFDYWVERGVLCSTIEVKSEPEKPKAAVRSATVKPGRDEVARRGLECEEIAFILREAEQKFGRVLRQSEASTLVWLYDDMGLSASLILMIVGFAVTEGRPNIGFIERTAVEWANDGVSDIEAAEARLVLIRRRQSAWHTVETAMGLEHRSPTKAELEAADCWVNEWNYGHDIIREAYEACVNATSKISMPYIKKIISEWHKSGVKTVEDIAALKSHGKADKSQDTSNAYNDFLDSIINLNEGGK